MARAIGESAEVPSGTMPPEPDARIDLIGVAIVLVKVTGPSPIPKGSAEWPEKRRDGLTASHALNAEDPPQPDDIQKPSTLFIILIPCATCLILCLELYIISLNRIFL